jgi:predicted nucleic acid-binding Zn ribbon protein
MNGVKLKVIWEDKADGDQFFPTLEESGKSKFHDAPLSRRIGPAPIALRCPHCNSIVYSRRSKLCGLCSQALPEEFLFSSSDAQRIENILRTEQRRHRQWMSKSFREAVTAPHLE